MSENTIVLDLSGDVELVKTLSNLPQRVYDNIVKTSFRGPAKRIVEAARRTAPKDTGLLKREIKVRTMRKRKGVVGVIAGTGPGGFGGKAFYGHFQEKGWVTGKRTAEDRQIQMKGGIREPKKGQRRIPGKFFIKRAFDANKNITQQEMKREVYAAIEKELAKEAKRQARKAAKQ